MNTFMHSFFLSSPQERAWYRFVDEPLTQLENLCNAIPLDKEKIIELANKIYTMSQYTPSSSKKGSTIDARDEVCEDIKRLASYFENNQIDFNEIDIQSECSVIANETRKVNATHRRLSIEFFNNILVNNILVLLLVLFVTFINGDVVAFAGTQIWLQIGMITLCYLLFGYRVFFGILVAIELSGLLIWHWDTSSPLNHLIAIVGAISPLLALYSMKVFKLSSFFEGEVLVFQHVIFLVLLTALYNTLMKFFVYTTVQNNFFPLDPAPVNITATKFIQSYLYGDILGGLVVLFIATLLIEPLIRYVLNNAPFKKF
ncbi:MAG: hypothetical protein QF407_01970 [Gammaproteobacteria bacterium]|jgi:hypothetical protein|nr:hypothetical protein [Gammaproteobacteria bacterium]